MAFFENGRQPRGARAFIQGCLARASVALVVPGVLGGCGDIHNTGPEAWWHEQVGGAIARQRPPPPGDKDPYPNLATVPPKPPAPNAGEWNRMTAGLMSDRIAARQAAALAPIPPPSPTAPGARPGVPGTPPGNASAALVGAGPPSAGSQRSATTTQSAAPVPAAGAKQTAPAPATGTKSGAPVVTAAQAPAQMAQGSAASAAERVANGQLPPLPSQEPARPGIAPAPPPPPVPVTAAAPVAEPSGPGALAIDFDRGSAKLDDAALAEVKALAAHHDDHGIAVTGYGDATASGALGQSEAVALGLSRAQAVASALVAQGVPYAMLRLNAESAGRGASLRLLQ